MALDFLFFVMSPPAFSCRYCFLMIVHGFDVVGVAFPPTEADSPLIVDPDAVLPNPVSFQCLQLIARWDLEILQCSRPMIAVIRYLLDTNICIHLIKSRSQTLFNKVAAHRPGEIGVSSITLAELEYGVSKSAHPERNREALRMFTIPLEVAPFDDVSAEHYGRVCSTLEAAGTPIGPLDTLIAVHGLALNAVVVTNNTSEFTKVTGLRVEDWSVD